MLPPHQRFDRRHLLLGDGEERLITHDELGALHRSVQLHLHRQALHRALIDGAVVQVPAISALVFAGPRGCIGRSEKASHLAAVLRENSDADARGDKQLLSCSGQRVLDLLLKELRDSDRVFDVAQVRSDEYELVAAEPRQSVRRPDARGEPPGDRAGSCG